MKTASALFLIIALGIILRIVNISSYKYYPDAYQNLLVAENLSLNHNVVGTLGDLGMVYPQQFSVTRPIYPLLINAANLFVNDLEKSATLTSFVNGILAIFVSFMLGVSAFKSKRIGLMAAVLMAVSFSHTVWSGYIMSETTGILFLILGLTCFFRKKYWLAGIILGLASFARFEYIFAIAPLFLRNKYLVVTYLITFLFILGLFYPPIPTVFQKLFELKGMTNVGQLVVNPPRLVGLLNFIRFDFLLIGLALLGFLLLVKKHPILSLYVLFCFSVLEIIYIRTNPAQQRYSTHLLPFLLLPAAYSLTYLPRIKHLGLLFILPFIVQIFLTYQGIRHWSNGDWFRTSYEQTAAKNLRAYLHANDVIVTAWPEVYYFFTNHSVLPISDTPPYVYLNYLAADQPITIVLDMASFKIYPNFSAFLTNKYSKNLIATYSVHIPFRYAASVFFDDQDVQVFRLTKNDYQVP
jgi:4-amino-4-deoxy-L-arabinose transferase-like glycosyltransferase